MAFLNSCSIMQGNYENAKAPHNLHGSASTLYFFFSPQTVAREKVYLLGIALSFY